MFSHGPRQDHTPTELQRANRPATTAGRMGNLPAHAVNGCKDSLIRCLNSSESAIVSFRIDTFYAWTQSRSTTVRIEQDHIRNRATAMALVTDKPPATVEPHLSPASTLGIADL